MVTVINRFLCANKLDFVFQLSYIQMMENTGYLVVLTYHSGNIQESKLFDILYVILM